MASRMIVRIGVGRQYCKSRVSFAASQLGARRGRSSTHNIPLAHADHDDRLREHQTRTAQHAANRGPADADVELEPRVRDALDETGNAEGDRPLESCVVPVDREREAEFGIALMRRFLEQAVESLSAGVAVTTGQPANDSQPDSPQ